jgi:hypothetical protein
MRRYKILLRKKIFMTFFHVGNDLQFFGKPLPSLITNTDSQQKFAISYLIQCARIRFHLLEKESL